MTLTLIIITWIAWGYWEDQAMKNYFRRRYGRLLASHSALTLMAYAAPPLSTLSSLSVFGWGYWSDRVRPYNPLERD